MSLQQLTMEFFMKKSILKRLEKLQKQIDYLKIKKFKKVMNGEICVVRCDYGYKLTDNKFDQDIKKIKNSINQLRDCYIEKVYPS
jgi:hypothetical protein